MREIALDTETTGLSFNAGDRITEIGCVEIVDKVITGKNFHLYINPERDVPEASFKITGLTYDFLKKFKPFRECFEEFLDFVRDDRLVIHNASFDMGFLNYELSLVNARLLDNSNVVDTLAMAKEKFPGSPSTLDALCRRFSVDASSRTKHGALIDAELLAEVYLHMSVEHLQKGLFGTSGAKSVESVSESSVDIKLRNFPIPEDEKQSHQEFLNKLKNPIWKNLDLD